MEDSFKTCDSKREGLVRHVQVKAAGKEKQFLLVSGKSTARGDGQIIQPLNKAVTLIA